MNKKKKEIVESSSSSSSSQSEYQDKPKGKQIFFDNYNEMSIDVTSVDIFSLARFGKFQQLKKIFDMGVDPNSRDKFGNTILIVGAQNGNKSIVKLALRYGGHINLTNCQGNTAVHFCVEFGYKDLSEYLVSKGANLDIANIKGFKPQEGIKPRWEKVDYM